MDILAVIVTKVIFMFLFVVLFSLPMIFLMIGGFILQRDRYWRRIWFELGQPRVQTIKELKQIKKEMRPHPFHSTKRLIHL